jgi:site-specific recombinase XerD
MSELAAQVDRYLAELARRGNSVHTVDAYGADLREFLITSRRPKPNRRRPGAIDLLILREWLASLYSHGAHRGHHPAKTRGRSRAVPLHAA